MNKKKPIEIIFQDNDLVLVNKPPGLLSIPDRYDRTAPNLRLILKEMFGDIFVVHRLDRDTSGIMVFLKNAESHRKLNLDFDELKIKKYYHVVVAGQVRDDEIKIDIPLTTDPSNPGRTIPMANGKESLTILRVLERFRHATFAECELVTGRHHQLRVHCSAIGHPLLIDNLYGRMNEFFLSSIKRKYNLKKNDEEKSVISRITMHAFKLGFEHPSTGSYMSFEADYPKDFKALLSVLKKYSSASAYF